MPSKAELSSNVQSSQIDDEPLTTSAIPKDVDTSPEKSTKKAGSFMFWHLLLLTLILTTRVFRK